MSRFFQKGYSTSPEGLRLQKSAGYANAGIQAFNILNSSYGATNKTGNALSSIGGVMGSIPTPYTAIAGAALGLAGGIANAFTDTVNEDYVNQIGAQISNLANTTSEAGDFSTLQQSYRDLAGTHIDLGDIDNWGSAGIFSQGSKREQARATAVNALETAKLSALGNLNQQGRNINRNNFANQYSQLLAFGGPITGAIDYANMMDYSTLKRKQIDKGLQYAKGGGIYIKPSKRGTFTAAATKHGMGVQEFANKVLANKEDYSPAMVKKANFARNASKWHAFGGDLMTNGATWDNGFTYVGNGGSHESNPNEGVQVGIDPQGIPNLVEEGEVIWNDYVFSKRLKVPRAFKAKYKLKDGGLLSFADAAKKFAEENKERPNDPISKRGRDALLTALMDQQEEVRLKKQQREARAQFNSLTPDEQLGIMQMAQQNAMLASPEEEYNNMEDNPMMMEEAPMMAAFGGKVNNRYDFGSWLIKTFGKDAKLDNGFVNGLKQIYSRTYKDPKTPFVDYRKIDDENPSIDDVWEPIANILPDNITSTTSWDTMTPDLWKKAYQRYLDEAEKFEMDHQGIPYSERWSEQYLKNWNPDLAKERFPERKTANRYFLRDTDDQGNPIATPLTNIPDIYEGYSTTTGQTWDQAIQSLGFSRVGTPQKSSDGDTDYTDYFFSKKAPATTPTPQEDTKITMPLNLQQTATRYAPVIGAGIGILTDALGLTNTPDFSGAQAIERAAERVGKPSLISAKPIGNRLAYKPFDLNYFANQARSNAALTGRSIMNQSSGNIGATTAGLLALGQNTTTQMGDLFRKAEEFNLEQRAKVEDFNRATDMFNAQQELTAARANQAERRQASAAYAAGIAQAEALRQRAQQYSDTARSANLTNFLQGLGDIGNENEQRNWLKTLYATDYFGNSPTMERVLYSDSDVLANYMKNNPSAKVDDVVAATGINKKKVTRYFKKKGLTI